MMFFRTSPLLVTSSLLAWSMTIVGCDAFVAVSPVRSPSAVDVPASLSVQRRYDAVTPTTTATELRMIGGLFQGLFGKTDAEITDTVYFDIDIDGKDVGVRKQKELRFDTCVCVCVCVFFSWNMTDVIRCNMRSAMQ
jgi:hypothetical protein